MKLTLTILIALTIVVATLGETDSLRKNSLTKAASKLRIQRALTKEQSKACPSGSNGECSGNGACVMECGVNGEKMAKCMCDSKYGGDDCSKDLCPSGCGNGVCKRGKCFCDPGWKGKSCRKPKKCKGTKGNVPCSGNGKCKYGKCFCDPGFEGEGCEEKSVCPKDCSKHGLCWKGKCQCNPGWAGEACGQFSNKKNCPKGCSTPNGICYDGKCVCSPQYTGPGCETEKKCPDNCNGHGQCYLGQCMCSPGFEGDACEKDIPCDCNGKGTCKAGRCHCMPGYEGESCEIKAKCPQDCSGHGICSGETCYCYPGFAGEACAQDAEKVREQARVSTGCPTNCNGHGVCGYGLSDHHGHPLGQCLCQPGWHGDTCQFQTPCPGEGGGCEGHGQCIGGKCYCRPGWMGDSCLEVAFNHTKCPNGCGGNGVCMLGECFCNPGFVGEDCTKPVKCPGKNGGCSGKGECFHGKCYCSPGFKGEDCSEREKCPNGCSSNGVCSSGRCLCVPGYTGKDCSHAPACEKNPCQNGVCAQGRCFCDDGWTGKACTLKVAEPSQNTTLLKQACKNQCSGHGTCDLSNMIKKGNMCFKCNCVKNWYGEDCSQMKPPSDDINEKCNMANHDCGSGGKVDEKSCKCICGKCRTGKFCTTVKKTAECAEFKEDDFKNVNKKVINKWGDDDLKPPDANKAATLDAPAKDSAANIQIPAKYKKDLENKLGDLVAEGKNFDEKAKVDQDEKKVKADFESIQSGAMIEMASKKECEKGCEENGVCLKNGVCDCNPGFKGKACSKKIPCPNGCSGRGKCHRAQCFCHPGFSGKDCTKVDSSFSPQATIAQATNTVAASLKAAAAAPPATTHVEEKSAAWHTSGVIIVGSAMFTIGVVAGLFSKFISDKRKRSEAKKILEETNHGDFEDDSMRNVLYSSLASPPMPMPPTVGL